MRSDAKTSEEIATVAVVPASFDAVYEAHFDYVYRLITRWVSPHEAEDLVQDVFLVVHRRLGEFEGRAKVTTWLFQIAYRVVGAHMRRRRLRASVYALFGVEAQSPEPPVEADPEPKEERLLLAALGTLSFAKRAVLVLYEVEGWSCEDIAQQMGVPVGTVHTRLHHARRDLARYLGRKGVHR